MRSLVIPPRSVLLVLLWIPTLLGACGDAMDIHEPRDLGVYRIHQVPEYPGGFPAAWAGQFEAAMERAPTMSIASPDAAVAVRALLLELPWIDPRSVEVLPALPQGLRVAFRPLMPLMVVSRGDRPIAMRAARDGAVLPPGIREDVMYEAIRVPLDAGVELPPPGRIPTDPVVQEAYRLWTEADTIRLAAGINIVAIQRKSTYPPDSKGIAPAMSFMLDSGVEICWGRAEGTPDPFALDSRGEKLTLDLKALRLRAVLAQFPGLLGVGRVVVDEPEVKVYDPRGQRLELAVELR
jgi:hypothetical protein